MTLPLLDENGNVPTGIHAAEWVEIDARFGSGTLARVRGFNKLKLLYKLASLTGRLKRFLIFVSFVSYKAEPRDVDVVLIMEADFKVQERVRRMTCNGRVD